MISFVASVCWIVVAMMWAKEDNWNVAIVCLAMSNMWAVAHWMVNQLKGAK